jgi:hypothetical protein
MSEIRSEAETRGITRLCHFTPSRNLVHIASGGVGLMATQTLNSDERNAFTPTDLARLDGFPEHICCSIEYPNTWYLDKARVKDAVFRDWVVILINPRLLWRSGTLFCPRNAAAGHGSHVAGGADGFRRLFAAEVVGAGGRTFARSHARLASCPTDEQAEVLIPGTIGFPDIIGVVVRDEAQARNEVSRLRLLKLPQDLFKILIVPEFFDKNALSGYLRSGRRPTEKDWKAG